MTRQRDIVLLALTALSLMLCGQGVAADKPNIVFILADDLGYGDLGCYGQEVIRTPHLDTLASQGMRFTQFYSGSTVCAPSRSSLMTGQHTGHTYIRGNGNYKLRDDPHDITVATMLRKAGYATAMIGKSCTSANDNSDFAQPNRKGFDHFFGVLSHVEAHHYFPPIMYRNGEKITLPGNMEHSGEKYCHDLYLDDAKAWLGANANNGEPFFLLYSAHIPHASLYAPEKWTAMYRGKVGPERHVEGGHYRGTEEPNAEFAGMISRLDWEVGQIMAQLAALDVTENTIVIFASDNGAHSAGGHSENNFNSSGPLRGEKRELYEGGVRTPLIVRWPAKIQPDSVSDHVGAFWDLMPTACELAAIDPPDDIDGISFAPTLLGEHDRQRRHDYLYWELFEKAGRRAVRIGDFKAIQYNVHKQPEGPIEVYDLASDLDESDNIADQHPQLVERARQLFDEARTESPIDRFNFSGSK